MNLVHLPAPRLCPPCGLVHRAPVSPTLAHDLRPFDAIFMSNALKNLMLDKIGVASATNADFGSLHTAYSTTGANELTGGSPAYARKALTWSAAASGSLSLAATFPTWDVPAATSVLWFGGWDAVTSGTFLFMVPVGAGALQATSTETSAGITANTINAKAHGYVANTAVVFWGTLPGALTVGTVYYVISAGLTADVFEVATTAGGSAIDITGTAPFNFLSQKCVPEVFAGQGTYALSATTIDLSAVV